MRRIKIIDRPSETYSYAAVDEIPARSRSSWLAGLRSLLFASGSGGLSTRKSAQTSRATSGSELVSATVVIPDAEWAAPPSISARGSAREIVPRGCGPQGAADLIRAP
jgi:hypothetical protein